MVRSMKRYIKFLIFLIFLLCTCATTTMASLSKEEKKLMQTTIFKASYLRIFIKVVEVFHDAGYFIWNANEEQGVIITKWQEGTMYIYGEWGALDARSKISATVQMVGVNTTKVKLKYLMQTRTGRDWQGTEDDMLVHVAKKSYKKYFDLIRRRLKGEY